MIDGTSALKNDPNNSYSSLQSSTDFFDFEKIMKEKLCSRADPEKIDKTAPKGSFFIDLSILLIFGFIILFSLNASWYRQTAWLNASHALRNIEVKKGETLWQIANRYSPSHSDHRQFITKIIKINGLPSPDIHEGQMIRVPIYAD